MCDTRKGKWQWYVTLEKESVTSDWYLTSVGKGWKGSFNLCVIFIILLCDIRKGKWQSYVTLEKESVTSDWYLTLEKESGRDIRLVCDTFRSKVSQVWIQAVWQLGLRRRHRDTFIIIIFIVIIFIIIIIILCELLSWHTARSSFIVVVYLLSAL